MKTKTKTKNQIARIQEAWQDASKSPSCIKAEQKPVPITRDCELIDFEKIGTGYSLSSIGVSKNYAKA